MKIKQASGLPPSLSKLVFCQYSFWGIDDTIVVPSTNVTDFSCKKDNVIFRFDHTKTFAIPVTEEFTEHCAGIFSFVIFGDLKKKINLLRSPYFIQECTNNKIDGEISERSTIGKKSHRMEM